MPSIPVLQGIPLISPLKTGKAEEEGRHEGWGESCEEEVLFARANLERPTLFKKLFAFSNVVQGSFGPMDQTGRDGLSFGGRSRNTLLDSLRNGRWAINLASLLPTQVKVLSLNLEGALGSELKNIPLARPGTPLLAEWFNLENLKVGSTPKSLLSFYGIGNYISFLGKL